MSILDKLRPEDEASRRLFPGLVAFAVAAIGAVLVFLSEWLSVRWLGAVGGIMVIVGVAGGFLFIAWGFITFPREIIKSLREFRKRQQSTWKRPDWKP